MTALIVAMLICLFVALVILLVVAVPARRSGRRVLTNRGQEVVARAMSHRDRPAAGDADPRATKAAGADAGR